MVIAFAYSSVLVHILKRKLVMIMVDYKLVCTYLFPGQMCLIPVVILGSTNSEKEPSVQLFTFSQLWIHASQFVLGTAFCDPVGKSLKHHCYQAAHGAP